ncbi:MAG TPA: HAD family phosphatase [Paludibacter sp.]|nr:HAD family phosphatase [Paludibacter sp.]
MEMKQFRNISTLIFDFGGVIVNLDLPQCIQNLKNLGLGDVEKYLSNFGQSGFFLKWESGELTIEEFRTEIRKLTSNELTDKQIDDAWCSFLTDIPVEKIEVLKLLRNKYKLLLLSNTNPLHIQVSAAGEFAKYGGTMNDFFDKCYLSYEMGLIKPNANIFEALLKDAGVRAEECLFIDDGPKNIETASKLGFQTRLVKQEDDLSFLLSL